MASSASGTPGGPNAKTPQIPLPARRPGIAATKQAIGPNNIMPLGYTKAKALAWRMGCPDDRAELQKRRDKLEKEMIERSLDPRQKWLFYEQHFEEMVRGPLFFIHRALNHLYGWDMDLTKAVMKDVCNTNAKNDGVRFRLNTGQGSNTNLPGTPQDISLSNPTPTFPNSFTNSFTNSSPLQNRGSAPKISDKTLTRGNPKHTPGEIDTDDELYSTPLKSQSTQSSQITKNTETPRVSRKRPPPTISPPAPKTTEPLSADPPPVFAYNLLFPDLSRIPVLTALEWPDFNMLVRNTMNLRTDETAWYSFDNKTPRIFAYKPEYETMLRQLKPKDNVYLTGDMWLQDPDDEDAEPRSPEIPPSAQVHNSLTITPAPPSNYVPLADRYFPYAAHTPKCHHLKQAHDSQIRR